MHLGKKEQKKEEISKIESCLKEMVFLNLTNMVCVSHIFQQNQQ